MLSTSLLFVFGADHAMGFGGLVGAAADGANVLLFVFAAVWSLLMVAPDLST
jgi:uncharacterized membrane protein YtjA (UPF0391 family)